MSVEVIENGNIFDSKSTYLVNAVNCVGNMGAGIAKALPGLPNKRQNCR